MRRTLAAALLIFVPTTLLHGQGPTRVPLETGDRLEMINSVAKPVTYHGRKALQLVEGPRSSRMLGEAIALVTGMTFKEGTIEVDVAGAPGANAAPDMRGFIGVAFHISPDGRQLKTFYLRPTNGRADDQLRRNHATQYTADPDWPWYRLRKEHPGQYESYVDLVAGEWTHIRIVVTESRAELFVNEATQPALIVTDLKSPVIDGGLALWIGDGTEGYFSNLRVTPGRPGG